MKFSRLRHLAFAALILAVTAGPQAARADLITNGGFETGDFTGWTPGPNSYAQYTVILPVHSGVWAAQIAGFSDKPNTFSQTVATTLGTSYTLSFWRYQDPMNPTQDYFPDGKTLLTVTWNGAEIFSESYSGVYAGDPYHQFSFTVVGHGSDVLQFTSAQDPGFTYLDDVSLNVAAVPEPSTWAMMILGFAGLCLLSGRRRRATRIMAA